MNDEINTYIADERARGVRDEDIRKELLAKGWKEGEVSAALGATAVVPTPTGSLLGVGELVSASFNELTEHFIAIASIMAAPVACYLAVGIVTRGETLRPDHIMEGSGIALLLFSLIGAILSILATIGIMKTMRSGWTLSTGQAYKMGASYFWGIIWVSLLSGLATLGGLLLLIVPGIIIGVWVTFARQALVLDDMRGLSTLSYSRELVRNVWWGVFGRVIVVGLIAWLVSILFAFLPYLSNASMLFTVPFSTIYMVKLYDNLKAYKQLNQGDTTTKNRSLFLTFIVLGIVAIPVIALLGAGMAALSAFHSDNLPLQNLRNAAYQQPVDNVLPSL